MHNNMNVNVSGPVQPTSTYKTVVLKGNHSFASQVTEPNTKYVFKHNFDLGGGNVTIPANCVLEFDGGSLSNGTITGLNTCINAGLVKIFNTDVTLAGTWNVAEAYPEWFGAKGDNTTDDTTVFQKTSEFAAANSSTVVLTKKYYLADYLTLSPRTKIIGSGNAIVKVNKSFIVTNRCYVANIEFQATNNTEAMIKVTRTHTEEGPNYDYLLNTRIENIVLRGRSNVTKEGLYGIEVDAMTNGSISYVNINNIYTYQAFEKGLFIHTASFITCCNFSNMFLNWCKVAVDIDGGVRGTNYGITECTFTDIIAEGTYTTSDYFCTLQNVRNTFFTRPQAVDYYNVGPNSEKVKGIFYFKDDSSSIFVNCIYTAGESNPSLTFKKYDNTSGMDVISKHVILSGNNTPNVDNLAYAAAATSRNTIFSLRSGVQLKGDGSSYFPPIVMVGNLYTLSDALKTALGNLGEDSYIYLAGIDLEKKKFSIYKRGDTANSWEECGQTFVSVGEYSDIPEGVNGLITYRYGHNRLLVYASGKYRDCNGFTLISKIITYRNILTPTTSLLASSDTGVRTMADGTNHGKKPAWFNGTKFVDAYGFTVSEKKAVTWIRNEMLKEGTSNTVRDTYPSLSDTDDGYELFDTTLGKPIWLKVFTENGTTKKRWVDSNGFYATKTRGTTSERPTSTLTKDDIGYQYFDTDLMKPIWFKVVNTGTEESPIWARSWIDATGATV